jgi:hypothetical protein
MPQCPECSAGLPAEAKFCGRCGAAIPASGPDQDLTTPVAFVSPSPPLPSPQPAVPPPAQPTAPPAGPGQQWGAGPAQPWQAQQAPQWGAGPAPAQPWGAGGQQWGATGPVPAYPGAVAPQGGTSSQAVASGIMAIVAALGIVAACALPVQTHTNTFGFGTGNGSISLFKQLGNATLWWYLVEPIGVAVLALAAGIILMASHSRVVSIAAAGVLLGFGVQTAFLFLGYWRGFGAGQHSGPAGVVGLLAGLLLAAAGAVAVASAAKRT